MRFIKADGVGSVTFRGFKKQTDSIAAWTMEQSEKLGRRVKVAILPMHHTFSLKVDFLTPLGIGSTTCFHNGMDKLDPSIDLLRLKKAVEGLFEVNPILKSVVQMFQDKGFALFRHDDMEIDIPIYHFSGEQWQTIQPELVKPYLYRPNEPLYHIAIYEVEGDKYLFLDVAHTISDGMTLGLLLRTLNRLYAGQTVSRTPRHTLSTVQTTS